MTRPPSWSYNSLLRLEHHLLFGCSLSRELISTSSCPRAALTVFREQKGTDNVPEESNLCNVETLQFISVQTAFTEFQHTDSLMLHQGSFLKHGNVYLNRYLTISKHILSRIWGYFELCCMLVYSLLHIFRDYTRAGLSPFLANVAFFHSFFLINRLLCAHKNKILSWSLHLSNSRLQQNENTVNSSLHHHVSQT